MSHPLHGFTHAFDGGEVEKLKAAGWTVEKTQEPVDPKAAPRPQSQLEKNTAAVLAEKGISPTGTTEGNPPGVLVSEKLTPSVLAKPVAAKAKVGRPAKK
jgi:hypothetical protein